ncbi:MAG TPA: 30S ribosomal protein S18 [bacterium]|nr:30S ribosomal protein S18 [bacterium]HSA33586.1 30S ribosomal protein S18 [bacterium]
MVTYRRRKVCRFCANAEIPIDYKHPEVLLNYITERGKIIPRRISGICAKHQRDVAREIKKSRTIALLPYTVTGR